MPLHQPCSCPAVGRIRLWRRRLTLRGACCQWMASSWWILTRNWCLLHRPTKRIEHTSMPWTLRFQTSKAWAMPTEKTWWWKSSSGCTCGWCRCTWWCATCWWCGGKPWYARHARDAIHAGDANAANARHDNATANDGDAAAYDGHATTDDGHATAHDGNATAYDGYATAHDGNATAYDGYATASWSNVWATADAGNATPTRLLGSVV